MKPSVAVVVLRSLLASLAVASVGLAGCESATTVTTGTPGADQVAVESVQAFEQGEVLMAQVTVRNRGGSQRTFRFRFDFLAADGMQVDPTSGSWKQRTIQPGETMVLSQVAGSSKAKDFRLTLAPVQK
ncbi:MAG: YcfL family protein [Phycisphaerales bacterium]